MSYFSRLYILHYSDACIFPGVNIHNATNRIPMSYKIQLCTVYPMQCNSRDARSKISKQKTHAQVGKFRIRKSVARLEPRPCVKSDKYKFRYGSVPRARKISRFLTDDIETTFLRLDTSSFGSRFRDKTYPVFHLTFSATCY